MPKEIFIGQGVLLDSPGHTAPREIQIFPRGPWKVPGQERRFNFDDGFFDEIIANFNKAGNEVVVDYEHAAELSRPGQKAVAAGWISGFVKKASGLWAAIKEWTEEARSHIEAGEYKYISPAWTFKSVDPRTSEMAGAQLSSVALTNTPHFVGMEPLFASTHFYQIEKEDDMDLKKIAKALKLPEDSSEETILKGIAERAEDRSQAIASTEVLALVGLDEKATVEDFKKVLAEKKAAGEKDKEQKETLMARTEALEKRFDEMVTAQAKRDIENLIDRAITEGRVFPYEREELIAMAEKDVDSVKKLMAKRTVIVPLKDRIAEKNPKGKEGEVVTSDSQREINRLLGVSEDSFNKFWAQKAKEGSN